MAIIQIHRTQDAIRKIGLMKFYTVWVVTLDGVPVPREQGNTFRTLRAAKAKAVEIKEQKAP